ncbi:hypothetical protein [Aureivirga marina]|uniref:hypothetical protein n=1 Tax=Aureivirga marina TaxID=1182451 RepID=UPI0018C9A590|nr:hypothetical protein [Aureivirga marina]
MYSIGDTIAALLLHEFSWLRVFGIMFIGATLYAFEIPNYFHWIEKKTAKFSKRKLALIKTFLAISYFNPLWIARHLFFIELLNKDFSNITWKLLTIAVFSFLVNIPISLFANYIIQNKIHLSYRFLASAIFSGLMAIYYALSITFF